jgi:hypothetical protein
MLPEWFGYIYKFQRLSSSDTTKERQDSMSLELSDLLVAAKEVDPASLDSLPYEEEDDDGYSSPSYEEPATPESAPEIVEEPLDEPTPPKEDIVVEQSTPAEDFEYVFVTDDTGRKKLKVDYKDREGIKKAHQLAAGFQKIKTEREKLLLQSRETAKEVEDLKNLRDTLNSTWAEEGIAGIYNKMRAANPELPSWEDTILQEALQVQRYRNASPEERKSLEDSKELVKLKRAQEEWVRQQESMKKESEQAKEAAEVERFMATITPHFEKHRFTEIADSAKAERMDARLWREAKEEFKRLEDAGKPVTPAVAAKIFKDIADDIRSLISSSVADKTAQEMERKKKVAQTKVAGATEKGAASASKEDEFSADVAKIGGVAAFLKMIGRS